MRNTAPAPANLQHHTTPMRVRLALALLTALLAAACSDDTSGSGEAGAPIEASAQACSDSAALEAATDAAPDTHCRAADGGLIANAASSCSADDADAAPEDPDAATADYGDTHEGTEADDDDCKFHVKLSADCIARNQDVTFAVSASSLLDGTAATGATPYIEASLNGLPGPNTHRETVESAGLYQIPAKFDRAGRWTVRVHLYPLCSDRAESKHAHVAFYVDVP